MLAILFGVEFYWKDCIKDQEKKKKVVVLCSRPRQNVNLGTFTLVVLQRQQRNVQKSVMHVQSCYFAILNLLRFCHSRCRRRRRCLSSLKRREIGEWEVSGKLPTYPSPKLTLTLTSHLGQNDGLGEGRWTVSQKPKLKQSLSWIEVDVKPSIETCRYIFLFPDVARKSQLNKSSTYSLTLSFTTEGERKFIATETKCYIHS